MQKLVVFLYGSTEQLKEEIYNYCSNKKDKPGARWVAHTCGSSYSGGGGRRIEVLGQARHS
jgi:hypothetical protein